MDRTDIPIQASSAGKRSSCHAVNCGCCFLKTLRTPAPAGSLHPAHLWNVEHVIEVHHFEDRKCSSEMGYRIMLVFKKDTVHLFLFSD